MTDPGYAAAPGWTTEGEASAHVADATSPIVLSDVLDGLDFLPRPQLSPTEAAGAVDERYALIVVVKTQDARHKRRVYLSITSAQAAVDRALKRGQDARIVLVKLVPTGVVAHV